MEPVINKPKILLIEDDIDLAELTLTYLSKQGFELTHAGSAQEVLALPSDSVFDLIICDIMLPDQDGFSLFAKLQARYRCVIIFMTARDGQHDQIKGLDLGASDYLVKPINPELLVARIKANLRKPQAEVASNIIKLHDLTIDYAQQQLTIQGEQKQITTQEFSLLWIFANHHSKILSREFLFEQYVGRPYDGLDRAVDLKVSRLRKKIDSYQISGLTIKTVHGKGYLFNYHPRTQPIPPNKNQGD
ncbi:response regulator transcription factor [Shewanella sp. AS1]|uniref:response regulator transcription factor n=1 Tax=Shewanella sp. AS1 TaxID=2907626 RepID=UPI001F270F94|nr:response regulator transcription factor [Shewanella sp. AS1]MCE9677757.1 response regulator transcription factor [Shewanella sp. AS1]